MKYYTRKAALQALLAMTATAAFAQESLPDPDGEPVPELRRYTVEMIIFSYAQTVSTGTEIFVPDEPPPEEIGDDNFVFDESTTIKSVPEIVAKDTIEDNVEESADDLLLDETRQYAITMLEEEDYQLIGIAERLERLDAYEPLLHFGWTQPTYPHEEPDSRPLSSFVTPPEGLTGDLSLYLSRYLHLSVQLQLDAADSAQAGINREAVTDSMRYGMRDTYLSYTDEIEHRPVRYRIDEDRIFKNGDLRYFDHPKFGVIAKITRVEEEEPEQGFESGEMLGDMESIGGE